MSKTYSKYDHTHVTVSHPDRADGWDGTFEILLHTGARVWVPGSYSQLNHRDLIQVSVDGPGPTAFDEDGNCIIAVPSEWCSFYSIEEALSIELVRDAENDAYGEWHGRNE